MLSVINLVVGRGETVLFGPLTFNLKPGSILWVTGANGMGKTTLLKTLSSMLNPLQGSVCWENRVLHAYDTDYLAEVVYVGHVPGLHALLTPLEYLQMSLVQARGLLTPLPMILDAIKQAGLESVQHKRCGTLSRGQQQRLTLARCLIQSGRCWLMDEPLCGLDQEGQQWLATLLAKHSEAGGIAVVVSHSALALAPALPQQTLALSS